MAILVGCEATLDPIMLIWWLLMSPQSMSDVSRSITNLQPESQLFVLRGSPMDILPRFFEACKITHISFETDDDEYTISRDAQVKEIAVKYGVEVIARLGHTLYSGHDIIKANKGKVPTTYGQFQRLADAIGKPARPIDAPTSLPPPGNIDFTSVLEKEKPEVQYFRERDVNAPHRYEDKVDFSYQSLAGPNGDFAVPTMEELAIKPATSFIRGGETRALELLEEWMTERKDEAITFEKPKTSAAVFKKPETTLMSPHFKFGTLSIRTFYWRIRDLVDGVKGASQPPVSLLGQITFRDFFHAAQAGTPNFQRIKGNPISRYIDWDLQNQYDEETGEQLRDLVIDESNQDAWDRFTAWRDGRTGYPWIDAQMRKLKRDGWIHHLARHSTACFLTRQLYISWERGAEVFDCELSRLIRRAQS